MPNGIYPIPTWIRDAGNSSSESPVPAACCG